LGVFFAFAFPMKPIGLSIITQASLENSISSAKETHEHSIPLTSPLGEIVARAMAHEPPPMSMPIASAIMPEGSAACAVIGSA
jgi:hypothetical protein